MMLGLSNRNGKVPCAADELIEDATHAGFYGELVEAVKPYGGAEGYVGSKLQDVPR